MVNGRQKCSLIDLRRLVESAHFAHELQSRILNLRVSRRRIKVEKGFYVSAHSITSHLSNTGTFCDAISYQILSSERRIGSDSPQWIAARRMRRVTATEAIRHCEAGKPLLAITT